MLFKFKQVNFFKFEHSIIGGDKMKNQNNRQGNNDRENNNNGGVMNKIGQAIENVVDTVTGDNQNNGQQRGRHNDNQ